jgi:hypothetical protein
MFYLLKNSVNIRKFKDQLLADSFCLATLPKNLQKKMDVVG